MATTVQLKAARREDHGKGVARKLRRAKRIPGVVYGRGSDPEMVALDEREFLRTVTGHSVSNLIVDLLLEGTDGAVKTLIREIQLDPVDGSVLHVDLNRISMTERLVIEVPIDIQGTPAGVKEGGVLSHAMRSLEIKCLAQDIPASISVDVSALKIGDTIHVRDLEIPNVEILTEPQITLATVTLPKVHEEPTAAEAEAAAAAAEGEEPGVVGKEEEGGEKEGEEEKKKD